ncbi:cobalamin B12-binding domain-containing protein [Planococcus shixiaomingii]|uniref:cobalamin B12-binding domain-containing protein n=1 Tax=Planococcus shixiaomingii TaxID=3058393 RepID=UPI002625357C|nr:cobalamin B12-binding domain-containing protein [Planococcus sp. N022]WKA53881.1 cobalamin B12-binding domain-containing protein [Planococcus sp. N022]
MTSEELADIFLSGDDYCALNKVQDYLKTHTRKELFQELLTPAMYRIGQLWQENAISVADEHLATAICDFVISATDNRSQEEKENAGKVMIMGFEGEDHYLGLKMVACVFREHGWTVRYMGPNLPLAHALDAAKQWKPDVIGLSAALVSRLPLVKTYMDAFRTLEPKPVVLLGGRAVALADLSDATAEGAVVLKSLETLQHWIQARKESNHEASA